MNNAGFQWTINLQWTNYVVNISNIVIWPDYPRFPGPIFFNVTIDVSEELPQDKVEMDVEVLLVMFGDKVSDYYSILLVIRMILNLLQYVQILSNIDEKYELMYFLKKLLR